MKKVILPILLTVLVLVSLGLSYLLIFDFERMASFVGGKDISDAVEIESNQLSTYEFYKTEPVDFKEVLKPSQYIVRKQGEHYQLINRKILKQVEDQLTRPLLRVENMLEQTDKDKLDQLYRGDYFEISFHTPLPLSVMKDYLDILPGLKTGFTADHILIPFADTPYAYLINSKEETYIRTRLKNEETQETLMGLYQENTKEFTPVERYLGLNDYIYLPFEEIEMETEIYTLEVLPQYLFVNKIFASNSDYNKSEIEPNRVTYKSYQYTLEFDNTRHRLDYTINRITPSEPLNRSEKLESSFKFIEEFHYWKEDMVITSFENNVINYRRMVNHLPIYVAPGLVDYGASYVYLRSDEGGEPYRYQMPLIMTQAHIKDQSEPVTLVSGDEIVDYLYQLNYALINFDRVFLAYEWQAGMEEFKKAELVPKWYFEFAGKKYSYEQLETDSFRTIYESTMEKRGGE